MLLTAIRENKKAILPKSLPSNQTTSLLSVFYFLAVSFSLTPSLFFAFLGCIFLMFLLFLYRDPKERQYFWHNLLQVNLKKWIIMQTEWIPNKLKISSKKIRKQDVQMGDKNLKTVKLFCSSITKLNIIASIMSPYLYVFHQLLLIIYF